MTTNCQFDDGSSRQDPRELPDGKTQHTNESTGAMDMVKRDRFELLSAYLDGEVTAAQRKQVEEWLSNDASVQCLYARLLKLRQGVRTIPIPEQMPVEETVQRVMARIGRRSRLAILFGGTAIAACVIGAVSSILPGGQGMAPQLAQQPSLQQRQEIPAPVAQTPLMVALNNPPIPIPKAAETKSENPVNPVQPPQAAKQNLN